MMFSGAETVRRGLCLAAGLVLVAGEATAAEWTFTPTISASETFTDNIDLEPNGQKRVALITQVAPGVDLRGTGKRLNLALSTAVNFTYTTLNAHQTDLDVNLTATGNAEILTDLFFFDASASISQQALDAGEATSATDTNDRNLDTVQTYIVSPYLRHRLGNFADAEERYTALVSRSSSDTFSDSVDHIFDVSLTSGTDFNRLLWTLSARAVNTVEADDADEKERSASLGLEFVVTREVSLLGGVGYEKFDFGANRKGIEGVTWNAGLRLRPGPRLDISGTYGQQFGANVFDVTVDYAVTARTTFVASITNALDEPQDEFGRSTSSIGIGEDEGFIDTRSGQSFDPNTGDLGVRNERQRTTTYSASLNTILGRNTFGLSYSRQEKEGLFSGAADKSNSVSGNWRRQINPRTDLSTAASYINQQFGSSSRENNQYTATASLNFRISRNASASLSYNFRRRESTISTDQFNENAVVVGARYSF